MDPMYSRLEGQIIDKYRLIRFIDSGTFGGVFEAAEERNDRFIKKVAIKIIKNNGFDNENYLREIHACIRFNHPNILKGFVNGECELDFLGKVKYIVTELASENLYNHYKSQGRNLSNHEAKKVIINVVNALKYLHVKQYVHRDLKPENILLVNGVWKLADFGQIRWLGNNTERNSGGIGTIGTKRYVPPEGFKSNEVSTAWDMWQFGVILMEILTGKHPYGDDLNHEYTLKILGKEPKIPADIPEPFIGIIKKCLKKEKEKRWSAPQVLSYMNDRKVINSRGMINNLFQRISNHLDIVLKIAVSVIFIFGLCTFFCHQFVAHYKDHSLETHVKTFRRNSFKNTIIAEAPQMIIKSKTHRNKIHLNKSLQNSIFRTNKLIMPINISKSRHLELPLEESRKVDFPKHILKSNLLKQVLNENASISETDIKKAIYDYFNEKKPENNIYKMVIVKNIKVENSFSKDSKRVHALYLYRAIPGNKDMIIGASYYQSIFSVTIRGGRCKASWMGEDTSGIKLSDTINELRSPRENTKLSNDVMKNAIAETYNNQGKWPGVFEMDNKNIFPLFDKNDMNQVIVRYKFKAIPGNKYMIVGQGWSQNIFFVYTDQERYTVNIVNEHVKKQEDITFENSKKSLIKSVRDFYYKETNGEYVITTINNLTPMEIFGSQYHINVNYLYSSGKKRMMDYTASGSTDYFVTVSDGRYIVTKNRYN